MKTPIRK